MGTGYIYILPVISRDDTFPQEKYRKKSRRRPYIVDDTDWWSYGGIIILGLILSDRSDQITNANTTGIYTQCTCRWTVYNQDGTGWSGSDVDAESESLWIHVFVSR